MENKTEWYKKLILKLNNIKAGSLDLDEYIEEVKSKIEAGDQALSMSGVIDSGEWDSTRVIGDVRKRFDQIEEKKGDWKGFYNGWIEGRMEMLSEIKGWKPDR